MKKTKVATKRITARIQGIIIDEAKRCAAQKRWSLNTYVEEALISANAESIK